MVKNGGSRFFFGLMVIPCVILCFISVVSFSTFAAENNKIKSKVRERDSGGDYCILFAKNEGEFKRGDKTYQDILLGEDGPCAFAIWGQVTVCFASILLGTLYTVKALVGVKV